METNLSLVFEHIEQDLNAYIENCPQPGLPEWKAKVYTINYAISPKSIPSAKHLPYTPLK